jgi:hypothetical protein
LQDENRRGEAFGEGQRCDSERQPASFPEGSKNE